MRIAYQPAHDFKWVNNRKLLN